MCVCWCVCVCVYIYTYIGLSTLESTTQEEQIPYFEEACGNLLSNFEISLVEAEMACASVKGPLPPPRVGDLPYPYEHISPSSVKDPLLNTLSDNPSNQTRTLSGGGGRGVGIQSVEGR